MKLLIDAGAFSVKMVFINAAGNVKKSEKSHHNRIKEISLQMLEEFNFSETDEVELCVTGYAASLLVEEKFIQEQQIALENYLKSKSLAKSLIYLGAQNTFYITKNSDSVFDTRKNSNCSAGTGAFFEEQATRLSIPLEKISQTVKEANSIAQIAGRCSVFSKTDMIHRMQEGESTANILLGLCYALVRNVKSTLLHNKDVEKKVLLCGGLTKNSGVVRAFKDLFKLNDTDFILDEDSVFAAALGLYNLAEKSILIRELKNQIETKKILQQKSVYEPLSNFVSNKDFPEFNLYDFDEKEKTFLGIDIGSTSTNLVLINSKNQMIYYSYVKTSGKPLDVVKSELDKLHKKYPSLKLNKPKIAVTGSGREYIGKEINANLVINEISAQVQGSVLEFPDTDTVFEIGGQDSKYMSVKNGRMIDFEMNKVCAAGTGTFLEEQIKKLDLSMTDFINLALKAKNPCMLGNRCTVFIEGSINKALAQGNLLEDVCAGLVYSIASNYLFRVVNQKKIGEKIAVQGGIAYNQAVVCAFRAITKKEIRVTPYFSVTGALGAASLLINNHQIKFNKEKNQLENAWLLQKSEKSYLNNYNADCSYANHLAKNDKKSAKKTVGIPRVIFLHKMFPLFHTMFTKLGFNVVLSPLTNAEIVNKANEYVTAETCYPIKLIYGHIAWLLEQKVDFIVLPRLYTIRHKGSVARKDYSCMYMQTSPLLMEEAFHLKERGIKLIMPELSLNFGKKFMLKSILSISKDINVNPFKMFVAAVLGFKNLVAHSNRLEKLGKEFLQTDEKVFVLISRVYNLSDPVLNMGIEEHLNKLGCRVVHLEHLEASYMQVEHDYKDMYWPFGQHILTGLKIIKANKNFYPIYITNHGCGPDTAIQHFFQSEMNGREYFQLEVDEHSSKVGIITRLEAFLYSLQEQNEISLKEQDKKNIEREKENSKTREKILLPNLGLYTPLLKNYFADKNVVSAEALTNHQPVNYAMNKEYFSMLVTLEELLNALKKDDCKNSTYDLYFPTDEGSEVFGQYGLLCTKELIHRGYKIHLKNFYLEDLIKRDDIESIFAKMIKVELEAAKNVTENFTKQVPFYIGEPLCLYQGNFCEKGIVMPFSEALLFHFITVDRKFENTQKINALKKLHEAALKQSIKSNLYTDIDLLFSSVNEKLDWCLGDSAKYRFAKLLCLKKQKTSYAVLVNSAEENAAIILKQLQSAYKNQIEVAFKQLNLDFEHREFHW